MNLTRISTIILAMGFIYTLLSPSGSIAQTCKEVSINATVVNGNVHLRSSTPRFTFMTFIKFRLTQGSSLAIVQRDTRVEVLERSEVVGGYEWFRVRYCKDDTLYQGWIYAGRIGNRTYLKFDDPKNPILGFSNSYDIDNAINGLPFDFLSLLVNTAFAQTTGAVIKEPEIKTNPFLTVLLGFLYVSIFVGALMVTRKHIFPESPLYCFLISLSILLILGFLSSTEFSGIIADVLAKGK
jgi:hypothetical protein